MKDYMRVIFLLLGAVSLCAAAPPDNSEVLRARVAIEKMRALVDAGAAPRIDLERAQDALADAQDRAVLHGSMSAADLTQEQAAAMVAAAQRQLQRRQKQADRIRSLLDAGVVSRAEAESAAGQVEFARQEYHLAVTRARLCEELAAMARAEQEQSSPLHTAAHPAAIHYQGSGVFTPAEFQNIQAAFQRQFSKPLPVSADGETAVHRALGFDHRGRVDVALSPDQPEGLWLRRYLEARHIPYFAFWHAVPGKATGAHIHIGPESTRLVARARSARGAAAD
jgi:hypothetical protein